MRKVAALLFACLTFLFCAVGCVEKTYVLPWDQFCSQGDITIDLDGEERIYIINLLNEIEWRDGVGNCLCDFTFYPKAQKVMYHSECGTFNDLTRGKTAKLTGEQRWVVNGILGITKGKDLM